VAGSQVLKWRRTALERAEKFLSEPRFPDCNLRGRWEPDRSAASSILSQTHLPYQHHNLPLI
uniref:Uncharacterized protein n=1 Tax=Terrapene triunguis TaxID=2587831 RepID=A0A674K1K7_9SAUR